MKGITSKSKFRMLFSKRTMLSIMGIPTCQRKGCSEIVLDDKTHLCMLSRNGYEGEVYLCEKHHKELWYKFEEHPFRWFKRRLIGLQKLEEC